MGNKPLEDKLQPPVRSQTHYRESETRKTSTDKKVNEMPGYSNKAYLIFKLPPLTSTYTLTSIFIV